MTETLHTIIFADSRDLSSLASDSVDLVVTSPPYPMIEMWDDDFCRLNPLIRGALESREGHAAFELMHRELDAVWSHVARVLKAGGWACINVGDATRTIGKCFQLYSNHTRITQCLHQLGLQSLPLILWRKQTNAPNKFMGSGMLPAGAYVTLEHEYILLFRKGDKRSFKMPAEIRNRQNSSLFWEERNAWFSDIWDFKGIRQSLNHANLRGRSAAFPFELAYRLISMYSVRHDCVLDPFLGTGTTTLAAIAACRNSIGFEIDGNFEHLIRQEIANLKQFANDYISRRLSDHTVFIEEYEALKGKAKYRNAWYGFPVVTSQETRMFLSYLNDITGNPSERYRAFYDERPHIKNPSSHPRRTRKEKTKDQLELML